LAKKFIFGVELLTGLAIGAAAAAAAVSFIIVFLVNRDIAAESGHMATVTAYAIGRTISSSDISSEFDVVTEPLILSGNIDAAVIYDSSENLIAASGLPSGQVPIPGETNEWYFSQSSASDYIVGVKPAQSSISVIYRSLIIGLAALTAALAVLAFFTPRYLARTVISPLREILVEADRFSRGGGIDPEAAGASFHRLVELLHERDLQLIELRKIAEQRAERVEKRSAAILSVLGSAVFAIDGRGNLSFFNEQSKEMFDLRDSDINKEFPWQRTSSGRKLEPILLSLHEEGNTSSEFQITDEDAKLDRMFSVVISRSRMDEIAVLVTDVTRISELERRMADQTAMADIGAASAGISHEMGNTLCALSGFVDLLTRGHSDERTKNIIFEVKKEVDSAQELIKSFGNFARSPEPETARLGRDDIISICTEACELDKDRCCVNTATEDFYLNADRKLLSSCICNVVRNALEADPDSSVDVSVSVTEDNLLISIADTGPGLSMNPEDIFRPFKTTKNRNTGNMGLGLSVSRRIIRSMGGELSGENRAEGGARFTITLPIKERRD